MPSHLTRVVFRNFVADKPLLYRGCLYRAPRPRFPAQHSVRTISQSPRRSFFNFFRTQRKPKPADLLPGFQVLTDLAHMQRQGNRPPSPGDVAVAFNALFAAKGAVLEDFHVGLASNAFRYLQGNKAETGTFWLTEAQMEHASKQLLAHIPVSSGKPRLELARELYNQLIEELGTEESLKKSEYTATLVEILAKVGASSEARNVAAEHFRGPVDPKNGRLISKVWRAVFKGFAQEGNAEELVNSVELLRSLALFLTPGIQRYLVEFFAEQQDLERAQYWFSEPVFRVTGEKETKPVGATYTAILKTCALNGDIAFGQSVVASILEKTPDKEAWDATFVWSAAIGKGVEEIERMMNVMIRHNDEARQKDPSTSLIHPDIDSINALVELCISRKDSYSAERFISMGEKRGIFPNSTTFTMQMEYRLAAKDLDGARSAYFNLQGDMSGHPRSVNMINRLIQALCEVKHHQVDDILAIVDDLSERKLRFAPETIAAVCLLHLRRGETYDGIDLLQKYAHHYSPQQRVTIRESLAAFILDGETSTADAWDSYQILRNSFPETPRDTRVTLMNEFFARGRSDMGCHVFFHMRNHVVETISANKDVYVEAFVGFARNADAESLELAHNQLKLDVHVEMDTRLRNALMLAYASTGNNKKALSIWSEIGASQEGPSYNSIAIAFRSCEGMPFGDTHAKSIWRRLKEQDVEIDKQIFTAYMAALARNQLHDEARTLIENAEDEFGFTPDLSILGTWFNTTTNIERQAKVEKWIKECYPQVWTQIEELGHWVTMDGFGYRQYYVNRDLDP